MYYYYGRQYFIFADLPSLYTPSFYDTCSNFSRCGETIESQGAPKMLIYIKHACTLAITVPLLSRCPVTRAMASFQGQFWPLVDLTGKYKDSVGQKAHCLCENHGGRLQE